MVTKLSTQKKTGTLSSLLAIGCIGTKHSTSITRHMTYGDSKILSIHEHIQKLYYCHMRNQEMRLIPTLIGMPGLSGSSMLMSSMLGQSPLHLTEGRSIFSGFDGLDVTFHSKPARWQCGCIALASLMPAILVPLAFWIPLWSSMVSTSYWHLCMAKLMSFWVHHNLLHDCRCRKLLIGAITTSTCEWSLILEYIQRIDPVAGLLTEICSCNLLALVLDTKLPTTTQ